MALHVNLMELVIDFIFLNFLPLFRENMAQGGGICVANHTTPIDVLILMCDRCYSLVRSYSGPGCLDYGLASPG